MKRIRLGMVSGLLIIGLMGCGNKSGDGKPKNVSDEIYDYGVAIVEVMDKYLDDEVSADEVVEKMFVEGMEFETDEEKEIESTVVVLWESMARYPEEKEKSIEFREHLAELLNLDTRVVSDKEGD